jgi:uncharacterized SAM-binding protein YcdF (DUF218 family)
VTSERMVAKRSTRPLRRNWVVIAVVIAFVVIGAITARIFIWPALPALPTKASAIIELAGPNDAGRDATALALARAGRAPILIQSTTVSDSTSDTCLPAVPGVRIMCFHPDPSTTRGEAQYIGRMAAADGWSSVILVTTPDQAWRARLRVSRCFPGSVFVETAPLPPSLWIGQIAYQWAASIKALTLQTNC